MGALGSMCGIKQKLFHNWKKNRTRTCLATSTKRQKENIYCVGAPTETVWCEIQCEGKKKLL